MPYFNSIKVQLELPAQRDIAQMTIFQFHKGTIRTQSGERQLDSSTISIP